MFYSLDEIASYEEWAGDPLENAIIVDADTLFHDARAAQLPPGTQIFVAPEAWPAAPPAAGDWVDEASWAEDEEGGFWGEEDGAWEPAGPAYGGLAQRLSAYAVELTAAVLLLFLLLALALDRAETAAAPPPPPANAAARPLPLPAPPPTPAADANLLVVPYETYWVTQGLHGYSYGHMAVDLAGGKGSTVLSPIHGTVRGRYVDQYGNTTLIIENERYRVTLLHGDYSVGVGDTVAAGQPVGVEGNHGYTTDMQGRSCRDRDCGYHTHLNIFDRQLGRNVNPLPLLGLQ